MLDRLLGRAALKEERSALEEERRRLREQLDAESERRSEAVRKRQDAEERVNRLEDRIAELEDRVDRASHDEAKEREEPSFRGVERLHGERLGEVLDRLASFETGPEGALTAMLGTDEIPDAVRTALGDRTPLAARASPCLLVHDDAGLVSAALRPPVAPEPFTEWRQGFRLDRAWFEPADTYTLALVRADLFALGVYEDGDPVDVSGFESDVKGSHSKGGFSQGRFERRRDAQVEEHLEKCRTRLEAADDPRYVVGDETVLGEFSDLAAVTRPVDATGAPEAALRDAHHAFWTVPLYLL
jgi:peptide subunit release factor 1 (eRF1)